MDPRHHRYLVQYTVVFRKNKLLPVLGFSFCLFLRQRELLAYQQEKTEQKSEHGKYLFPPKNPNIWTLEITSVY